MGTEQNKQLARDFFARFGVGDVAGALDSLSDDVNWWICGRPELLPAAGDHTKEQIAGVFQRMSAQMPGGLHMTVKGLIAEGDQVAIELQGRGELKNGRVYENQYHLQMTFRDGKICAVREYLDTQHVHATWFQA
jgi:ketosteroid isomerase-like protein